MAILILFQVFIFSYQLMKIGVKIGQNHCELPLSRFNNPVTIL